jgi:hypothetical protein
VLEQLLDTGNVKIQRLIAQHTVHGHTREHIWANLCAFFFQEWLFDCCSGLSKALQAALKILRRASSETPNSPCVSWIVRVAGHAGSDFLFFPISNQNMFFIYVEVRLFLSVKEKWKM